MGDSRRYGPGKSANADILADLRPVIARSFSHRVHQGPRGLADPGDALPFRRLPVPPGACLGFGCRRFKLSQYGLGNGRVVLGLAVEAADGMRRQVERLAQPGERGADIGEVVAGRGCPMPAGVQGFVGVLLA